MFIFDIDSEQRLAVLKNGLSEILSFDHNQRLLSYYRKNNNPNLFKNIDSFVAHFVVRMMSRHWKLGKKQCWRDYKKVKPSSLYYKWLRTKRACKIRDKQDVS